MDRINLTKLGIAVKFYNECNVTWKERALERVIEICKNLPHGSGIDGKCEISLEQSERYKIVFYFEFHHMDEQGYYCGWTEHNLILTPTFGGFDMRITGKNKNNIKDYLYDLWREVFVV